MVKHRCSIHQQTNGKCCPGEPECGAFCPEYGIKEGFSLIDRILIATIAIIFLAGLVKTGIEWLG